MKIWEVGWSGNGEKFFVLAPNLKAAVQKSIEIFEEQQWEIDTSINQEVTITLIGKGN